MHQKAPIVHYVQEVSPFFKFSTAWVNSTMQLEDYFNFLTPNDIRLKGTRIGIETILYDYIYHAKTPEEIAKTYSSLSLEQVYATILYYLHEQEKITNYLTELSKV